MRIKTLKTVSTWSYVLLKPLVSYNKYVFPNILFIQDLSIRKSTYYNAANKMYLISERQYSVSHCRNSITCWWAPIVPHTRHSNYSYPNPTENNITPWESFACDLDNNCFKYPWQIDYFIDSKQHIVLQNFHF